MADQKVDAYPRATSWVGTELLYLIQSALDKSLTLATLFANIPVLAKFAGQVGIAGAHDVNANSATLDVTKTISRLTNDQSSTATIPNGSFDGQIKIVLLTSATATTALAGSLGNASVHFVKAGDSATLLFTQGLWWVIGGTATVT